jgi:uncharacterized SAM-binding protein YcdF (DUF218 family)
MARTTMKIVDSGRRAGLGAAAGGLAVFLLFALQVGPIFHDPDLGLSLMGGIAFGALVGAVRLERWLLALNALLIFTFFSITDTPTMGQIANRWVRDDGPPVQQDAIVVLSGYVQRDSAIGAEATERLLYAIELYRAGVAPRLVTSRVRADDSGVSRSSTIDQARLLTLTSATAGWIELDSVSSTRDEAIRAAAVLLPLGATKIAVVTSPFHTRRACAVYEAVGFTVSCQPARERAIVTRHPINSETRLAAFGEYVYERFGAIKYRWKGWLPPDK